MDFCGLTTIMILGVFILFAMLMFGVFKKGLKLAWGLAINTILGLISIFALNLFGAGIPINIITLGISAIFGLLGVGFLLICKVLGFPLG